MVYCDLNENTEWEVIIIPYRSPVDGKVHRYFPDFYIKVTESMGYTKKYIIEIKPKKQTAPPKNQNVKPQVIFVRRMSMLRTKKVGSSIRVV